MAMRTKREIEAKFEEFKKVYKKMSDTIDDHSPADTAKYIACAAILKIFSWVLGIQNSASIDVEEQET